MKAVSLLLLLLVALSALGCRSEPELLKLGKVPDFSLTDQSGRPFSPAQLRGKVWAGAFMFTRCPTVCPRITRQMHELQAVAQTRKVKLHLVSFSVDPEYDTPGVLRQYADQYGADLSSWSFVTGDYEAIKRTAVKGFKIAVEGKADPKAEGFGILHGSHLVLVDRDLTIRGYYGTSEESEMGKLLSDAGRL